MRKTSPLVSYVLMVIAGGAAGWIVKRQESTNSAPVSGDTANARPARPAPPNGPELLETFIVKSNDKQKAPAGKGGNSVLGRYEELKKTMPVSQDPAVDFQKSLAEFSAQGLTPGAGIEKLATLGVLLGQWIDIDAKAAFGFLEAGYLKGGEARIVGNVFFLELATDFFQKNSLPALMDILSESKALVPLVESGVFQDIGKRGSLQDLQMLKAKAPMFFSDSQAGQILGREWPVERREELLAALDPKSAADALGGIMGRMAGTSGGDWVLEKLKNDGFPNEIREAMAAGALGNYFSNIKGVTLQQRLDIMDQLGTLQKIGADRAKNEMIFNSIRNCFDAGNSSDDYLYSLRHGILTAPEVADLAAENTPDPGKNRGEYNSQMFRTLAEENLPAAMEMLSGMSPAEQEKQKAYAARWWFRDTNPQDFSELTENLNSTGDDATKSMMQDAWNDKARNNLQRFGAAYLEWIKSLPEGENKTQALRSVQANASGKNAGLAVEAGNLLKKNP